MPEPRSPQADTEPLLPRRKPRDVAEMDITPMIDITFLLLIFFLVCSSPDAQTAVQLAPARYGHGVPQDEAFVVTLEAREGAAAGEAAVIVYLSDGRRPENRLPDDPELQDEAVRTAVREAQGRGVTRVLVKADRAVKHREVARISAAASREGMSLHLGVLEID